MQRNILLTLEFDGTPFSGWQIQKDQRSVQQEVRDTLRQMLQEPELHLTGSGRTDAGVHALGMGANFKTFHTIPLEGLVLGLNALLGSDIVVLEAREVPLDFCARFWARGKQYRYCVWNHHRPSALYRNRAWYVNDPLDLQQMEQASRYLLGRHDFSSFRAAGCASKHPVREIYDIRVYREGSMVVMDVTGSAFLRHMVRNMAGALVEVGKGIQPSEWIPQLLEARDRRQGARTAPAHGLYLVRVNYHLPPAT